MHWRGNQNTFSRVNSRLKKGQGAKGKKGHFILLPFRGSLSNENIESDKLRNIIFINQNVMNQCSQMIF